MPHCRCVATVRLPIIPTEKNGLRLYVVEALTPAWHGMGASGRVEPVAQPATSLAKGVGRFFLLAIGRKERDGPKEKQFFYGTRSVLHTCHPLESKLDVLDEIGAFGMIDDRPDFIAEVADEGLWAATKTHPWNRQVAESRDDVFGPEDWSEVVLTVLENLDQNERIPA
jgi:hypothetical protein